jgi:DNA-binding NarL/FixJ family response regulator
MDDIRILVADDHEIVRRGLRDLLESHDGWAVVAEAAERSEAVARALESKPEIAVLDVTMPHLNGFEAARRIREALPMTKVLILTAHHSDQVVREAEACGACGYLVKSDAGRDLIAAVESVRRHKLFFAPKTAETDCCASEQNGRPGSLARLTAREREIVQMLAEGKSNKDVAVRLNISVKTAETHRSNIMRKIGVHSLPDLTRFAIRNCMVEA